MIVHMKKDFRNAFNLKVRKDDSLNKFFVAVGNDEVSVKYTAESDTHWIIQEVKAPSHIRAMNVHGRLLEYILELAMQEKISISPACAYAQTFITRHPRFETLVPHQEVS